MTQNEIDLDWSDWIAEDIADELVAVLRGEKLRHRSTDAEPVRSE